MPNAIKVGLPLSSENYDSPRTPPHENRHGTRSRKSYSKRRRPKQDRNEEYAPPSARQKSSRQRAPTRVSLRSLQRQIGKAPQHTAGSASQTNGSASTGGHKTAGVLLYHRIYCTCRKYARTHALCFHVKSSSQRGQRFYCKGDPKRLNVWLHAFVVAEVPTHQDAGKAFSCEMHQEEPRVTEQPRSKPGACSATRGIYAMYT